MKKLTTTLCLTIALLLGSLGMAVDANSQACEKFSSKFGQADCKLGYYLGRAHANMGTLSAVIPNCRTVPKHQRFFTSYGNYLLENISKILGLIRGIDNFLVEIRRGKAWGKFNNKILMAMASKLYQYNKKTFSNLRQNDLSRVCQNFLSQIRTKELAIEPYLNQYLMELKKSFPKEYQEAQTLIRPLIKILIKLENSRSI